MTMNLSQAKAELANINTIEGLLNLIRDTSAKVEGAADDVTSLLYGGTSYGNPSPAIAAVLVDGTVLNGGAERLVRVDDSSVGKLLFSTEFTNKLDEVVSAHLEQSVPGFNDLSEVEQLKLEKEFVNKAVFGKDSAGNRLPVDPANPSMWDVASKNFVDQATGDFRIVAGAVSENSILMQTELTALVAKSGDFTVDGLDINHLRTLAPEAGKNAVLTNAITQTALSLPDLSESSLTNFRNSTPDSIAVALRDPNRLLGLDMVLDSFPASLQQRFDAGQAALIDAGNSLAGSGLAKGLNKLGLVGGVLGFMLAAGNAAAAQADGNTEQAQTIMQEWAVDFAGSEIGGIAGAAVAGIAVGIAAALGLAVTAPLAAAIIFGGMLVGGFVGADMALGLFREMDLSASINSFFNSARAVILQRDPLVLDLDGDGLELSAASGNTLFDHNADGIKTGTGWARPDDGFLVRDLNGNGSIDSGRELFGVDTVKSNGQLAAQGFDALADLDSNGDGQITSADAAWGQLQVWRDANQDGISQAGELSALDALGITRIGLNGSSTGPQAGQTINNNRVALSTTFTRNGVTRTVGAIDLEANGFFSEIPPEVVDEQGNPVVISEGAQALPQMNGSGMVRNLRAAMSLAGTQADELEAAVAAFSAATTRDAQLALIDTLITEWAQTSSYWSSLEGYLGAPVTLTPPAGMTAEQYRNLIGVLEVFNGSRFYGVAGEMMPGGQWAGYINGVMQHTINPMAQQMTFLQQAYDALKDSVYGALVMQTRLKPYLDAVELTIGEAGVEFDVSGIEALVLQAAQTDALNAIKDLTDLRRYGSEALQSVGWAFEDTMAAVLSSVEITPDVTAWLTTEKLAWMGTEATSFVVSAAQAGFTVIGNALDNSITGHANGAEHLYGMDGNDTLTSVGTGAVLDGGAGDDTLIASGLNATLLGGAGNDMLRSSSSSLYHMTWEGGTGNDTITGTQYADYYRFNRGDGADLISDAGSHLPTNASYVDELRFGEGISASDLGARRVGNDLVLTVAGMAGDQITIQNWFYGTSGTYRIEKLVFADGSTWSHEQLAQLALATSNAGTSGDDTITGTASYSEVISGGGGNDTLTAVGDGDVLDGGDGDDTLIASGLNATLLGGAGNDVLRSSSSSLHHMTHEGGTGNDTITGTQYADYYRFNRGDGADLISDAGSHLPTNASYVDELRFGEGISASDLGARRVGNDLVLTVAGMAGDQITIQNWFYGTSGTYRIEKLVFADGSTWSHEQLAQLALATSNAGTSGNDTITGTASYSEVISGGEGNDTLTAVGDGDVLDGGAGDDTLIASGLNATLLGGAGNDVLRSSSSSLHHMTHEGGTGNDTITGTQYADYYRFNRGDGADLISDAGSHLPTNASYVDELRFGEGISASDLGARRVGNDLVLTVAGMAGDQITIQNWFYGTSGTYRIEKLVFADGSTWSHEQLAQLALATSNAGTSGNDTITGTGSYSEVISGGEGNDTLTSAGEGDTLDGGAGDDTLIAGGLYTTARGGAGNDVLRSNSSSLYHMTWEGGTGNDTITGTQYADYYRFNRGDGADLISDAGSHLPTNASYVDELRFGEGISASDLGARRVGNDLVLTVAGMAGDQITIQNWFYGTSGTYRIEKLVFADGSTWSHEQLAQLALATSNAGTSGDDTITGTASYSEVISGGEGNDTLTSAGEGDTLDGGVGDDTLIAGGLYTTARGGAGNDVLRSNSSSLYHMTWEGGAGNDTITGTNYADYYRFNRGDGADLISDTGSHSPTNPSYADRLTFGEGISEEELWFSRSGNDLLVQVLGDGGQVQIKDWYASSSYLIEEMRLSDGQALLFNQVDSLVNAMAAFAPPAPGQTSLTPEQQTALAPVIAAAWN